MIFFQLSLSWFTTLFGLPGPSEKFSDGPKSDIFYRKRPYRAIKNDVFEIGADKLFSSLEMERFSPILSYILI